MQFVLVDVGSTLVFLAGYLAVVALQRRHGVPVATAIAARKKDPAAGERRPEWPRLSYPR